MTNEMTHDEIIQEVRNNPDFALRSELAAYLQWRGFAVYPNEPTYQLREAVICDLVILEDELS